MKKKYLFLLYGVLAVLLLCGIALVACDSGFGSNSNPFVGTWTGISDGERVTMVITDSRWEARGDYPYSVNSGTYTINGNEAIFYSDYQYGYIRGFVSGNSLTLYSEYGVLVVLYK